MNCYICKKQTKQSLVFEGVNFAYCDEHKAKVQFGVIKLNLTGSNMFLQQEKNQYEIERRGAASIEFEKQKNLSILEEEINREEYD